MALSTHFYSILDLVFVVNGSELLLLFLNYIITLLRITLLSNHYHNSISRNGKIQIFFKSLFVRNLILGPALPGSNVQVQSPEPSYHLASSAYFMGSLQSY